MKKLKVPLITQREGSYHCQVATLLMVLQYFGDDVVYDALLADLESYLLEDGMHNQGSAIYLLERKYKVFFAHHDLGVLSPDIEDIMEKDLETLENTLENIPDDEENQYRRRKISLDVEYIKKGGNYSTKLPTVAQIEEYLAQDIPVILGAVRNKGLHLNPTANNRNHAIVVTGKDDSIYYINDPSPKSDGQYSIHRDRLLHAWYHSGVQMIAAWK